MTSSDLNYCYRFQKIDEQKIISKFKSNKTKKKWSTQTAKTQNHLSMCMCVYIKRGQNDYQLYDSHKTLLLFCFFFAERKRTHFTSAMAFEHCTVSCSAAAVIFAYNLFSLSMCVLTFSCGWWSIVNAIDLSCRRVWCMGGYVKCSLFILQSVDINIFLFIVPFEYCCCFCCYFFFGSHTKNCSVLSNSQNSKNK